MEIVYALGLTVLFIVLTAIVPLGLPGHWGVVLIAIGWNLWQEGTFFWWSIGAAAAICALAELIELIAGAAGAKAAKSSNRAAFAAIAGGLIGGIVGTVAIPIPVVGTIAGAALGAAIAAVAAEATLLDKRQLGHLTRLGTATAVARFVAILFKTFFAAAAALVLIVDAFV